MLLKKGFRGDNVTALQQILGNIGYLRVEPTGFYGDSTKLAVVNFQRDNGLSADGVVGEKTLTALYAVSQSAASVLEPALPTRHKMTKDTIIEDKTGIEAGHVNNPDDLGGETKHGITKAVAQAHEAALVRLFGWDGEMRNLTKAMAKYIYVEDYWDKLCLDDICKIDPYIADKLFDIGINTGVSRAAEWLQKIICVMNKKGRLYPDISVDGAVGPQTVEGLMSAFRAHGGKYAGWTTMKSLLSLQGAHYVDISYRREANETFFMGWMNRLDHNTKLYHKFYNGA